MSGPSAAAGSGGRSYSAPDAVALACGETGDKCLARRADGCEHDQLRGAAVRLVGVVGDHRDPCARAVERPWHERVLAERRRAYHDDGVERLEGGPQPRPVGRQVACETRVILRKPGPGTERLLPNWRVEPLRELDERVPRSLPIRPGADDEGGALCGVEQRHEGVDGGGIGGRGAQDGAGGRGLVTLVRRRCEPVVHRHDDERRPPPRRRRVPRAVDRAGQLLRPDRLLDRDRIRSREPLEAPGEERLVGEVPPVLLADEHDERRAVDPRGREGPDGVPETGRRVEEDESGLVPADRPARRHPDHGCLVQPEDELEVRRQVDQ